MARISGQAQERFNKTGYMTPEFSWNNESAFGAYNNQTNAWEWNSMGQNSTIYKMMSWAKQQYATVWGITADEAGVQPDYFTETYFAGLELPPNQAASQYGLLVPLVCLYKIDWQKYYSATNSTA